jgi:fumarylacetoacetase
MSSDFTLANLPFGVAGHRAHVAIGDHAVDLFANAERLGFDETLFEGTLNRLAGGPWRDVRARVREMLVADGLPLVDRGSLTMEVPVAVGDYVDGYAGIHHATNLGRILRPGAEPLNANWRHLPVMYHGRSGTIVTTEADIARPWGQVLVDDVPQHRSTDRLDFELELGTIVGTGNRRGEPIPVDEAREHLFGFVLVNDWSARDIQAFEYVPLGPFLGKSFATSISPWVVTVDALEPHLVPAISQAPAPLAYLRDDHLVPDLTFTVEVNGQRFSEVQLAGSIYWTPAQQLAHLTVNGASTRTGDLVATGTISGPDPSTQAGSMIERQRGFLADGDVVTMRGWAGAGDQRVGFGELTGRVSP